MNWIIAGLTIKLIAEILKVTCLQIKKKGEINHPFLLSSNSLYINFLAKLVIDMS